MSTNDSLKDWLKRADSSAFSIALPPKAGFTLEKFPCLNDIVEVVIQNGQKGTIKRFPEGFEVAMCKPQARFELAASSLPRTRSTG